jgi:hypothetical protein
LRLFFINYALCHEDMGGTGGTAPPFLTLAQDEGEWGRFTPGERAEYPLHRRLNVKGSFVSVLLLINHHVMKTLGNWRYSSNFLDLGTKWRRVGPLYTREKGPYPRHRRLNGKGRHCVCAFINYVV